MKKIEDIGKKCTGCGACKNICPVKCINMYQNKEGFYYPKINLEKCKKCGLCEQICPINQEHKNISINECYYGYNLDDKIRMKSSSGGIFYELSKSIIDKGGLVCGAGYDKNNKVIHKIVDNINDIYELMGSKYVQSDTLYVYSEILKQLKNDKTILFSGTPCQVAGLKSFLKKEFEKLYTISFICHGVPSSKIYEKFLNEMYRKYKSNIQKINFRNKEKAGWSNYSLKINFINGKEYNKTLNNDLYLKTYLSNATLRESCYQCNFKENYSDSDITIGDFWGIEKYINDDRNKLGVSAVIINTQKGCNLINNIKNNFLLKEIDYNILKKENKSYFLSSKRSEKRDAYFKEVDKYSIKRLYNRNCKSKNIFVNVKKNIYLFLKEKGVIK